MGTALNMTLNAGLGRRFRPPLRCMRRIRMLGSCMMNIGTKGIRTPWALKPTPICAVCWITCPKPKG